MREAVLEMADLIHHSGPLPTPQPVMPRPRGCGQKPDVAIRAPET
jgi:hypothetical protein